MSFSREILVLTIRLADRMDYELKEILHTIGTDVVAKLTWGVGWLDWIGSEDAIRFNREVDTASGRCVLVSGKRLLELSKQAWQTIEGRFVGYRSHEDARAFLELGSRLTQFAVSSAEMAVDVKDGYYFDVYLRSRIHADRLTQRFQDVHWHEPTHFPE